MWHLAPGSPLNKCLTNLPAIARGKAVRDLSGLLVWAIPRSMGPAYKRRADNTRCVSTEHTATPAWCQRTFEKEALIGVPVSLKSLGQSFPKTLPAFWGHPCSQCCGSALCAWFRCTNAENQRQVAYSCRPCSNSYMMATKALSSLLCWASKLVVSAAGAPSVSSSTASCLNRFSSVSQLLVSALGRPTVLGQGVLQDSLIKRLSTWFKQAVCMSL